MGTTADNPDCKIELKTFHSEIMNDHEKLKKEEKEYLDINPVRMISSSVIEMNYIHVKDDISEIVNAELERLLNDPALVHLVIKKKKYLPGFGK